MAQIHLTLDAYLTEMAATPFAYGHDDCASFVVGWFDRLLGGHALAAWRGRYATEADCAAYIARNGGFAAIADDFFAAHYRFGAAAAARGTAVLARVVGRETMGLRISAAKFAFRTPKGLLITERAEPRAEWGPSCLRS